MTIPSLPSTTTLLVLVDHRRFSWRPTNTEVPPTKLKLWHTNNTQVSNSSQHKELFNTNNNMLNPTCHQICERIPKSTKITWTTKNLICWDPLMKSGDCTNLHPMEDLTAYRFSGVCRRLNRHWSGEPSLPWKVSETWGTKFRFTFRSPRVFIGRTTWKVFPLKMWRCCFLVKKIRWKTQQFNNLTMGFLLVNPRWKNTD